MLNVLITVDTEFWADQPGSGGSVRAEDIDRDVYGVTPHGEFGVRYQADLLQECGLKGVFHIEALSALATGIEPHTRLVEELQQRGQDVQLHVHPEWLSRMPESLLPGRTGQHMHQFSLDEQEVLLAKGLEILRQCGAQNVCAFRAGNYGANWDTLRALARLGVPYDTSHNTCYLGDATQMETESALLQPRAFHGVHEFPVGYFHDRPGHRRHLQITACSARELIHAVEQAFERGWEYLVLVSHSFELIDRRSVRPDNIAIRRFERFCRHLSGNRDRFRTIGFDDIEQGSLRDGGADRPLRSNWVRTALRYAEQAMRRFQR